MPDPLPSSEAVDAHIAAFESELAQSKSAREAQSVRDRYLGRKNSVVATWMQLIAGAPDDQKKTLGRLANDLKQALDERWDRHKSAAPFEAASSVQSPPRATLPVGLVLAATSAPVSVLNASSRDRPWEPAATSQP